MGDFVFGVWRPGFSAIHQQALAFNVVVAEYGFDV